MDSRDAQIRLFDRADDAAVSSLGPAHGPSQDGDRWRRTVIAEVGHKIIAAGTMGRNTMHRDAYWLEIDADPGDDLATIGVPVYRKLRGLRPAAWPVWWRAMATRPERLTFAAQAGFAMVVNCPVPQVNPTSVEAQQWVADHADAPDVVVRTAESCTTEELLDAWATYYEWAHAGWMPVISINAVRAQLATGLINGLDRSLTTIAVREGRIAAMAQVFPDVWDGRTTLVCAETVRRDEPDGYALVGAVVAASLRRIADSGRTTVDFEGHDIDPHYGPLVATLPAVGFNPLTLLKAE